MARQKFPYRSDSVIRLVAPTDVVNQNPLDTTDDGSVCSFRVYDPNKDETLSAAEASGQTVLSVVNAGVFVVGDSVELTQDDGSLHTSDVTVVDAVAGTVDIADPTTFAAAAGSRFRVIFGGTVVMVEYGTPVLDALDWGFQGTLADNNPAIVILDQEFDVEISFVGAVAGGLDLFAVICGITKPLGECDC